jgi:hypothetical protein
LVDALEGVSNALPALVPIIQRKLIEVISNVLNPGGYVGGYQGWLPRRCFRSDGPARQFINRGSVHGINSTMNSIDAIGNNNTNSVGSKLKKVFSGVFMTRQVAARTGRSLAAKLGALRVGVNR